MKKFFLLALASIFLINCESDDYDTVKQEVPHFDETNTIALEWSELPDELRNAPALPESSLKSSYYCYSYGAWGGSGGNYFDYGPLPDYTIHAIGIHAGTRINCIKVWYKTVRGDIYLGLDKGGTSGKYYLQNFSEYEYIKSVSGRTSKYVDRLSFTTNKKTFTYGGNGGVPFSIGTLHPCYQVLGFYGKCGSVIDQIGFHIYTR